MTASATVSRPVLYVIPGGLPREPATPVVPVERPPLPVLAAEAAAQALGTLFAPVATRLARGLAERAPLLARRGRPELWVAAVVFVLAEEARLFECDRRVTRTALARELGSTLPTVRRRAHALRVALHPLELELPDPEGGYPDADTA